MVVVVFCAGITRDSRAKIQPEPSVDEKTSALPVNTLPVEILEPVKIIQDKFVAPEEMAGEETRSPESNHRRTGICLIFVKSLSAPLGLIPR